MSVIVTGGAGYIGSHVVAQLVERGENVVIVDDLSAGLPSRVPGHKIHQIDLSKESSVKTLRELTLSHSADSIIHFAAKKSAPESVTKPEYYFRQNVGGLLNVIAALRGTGVTKFVFSSSAAVYGDARGQVTESSPTVPMNPYGDSKLMGEQILNRESTLGVVKLPTSDISMLLAQVLRTWLITQKQTLCPWSSTKSKRVYPPTSLEMTMTLRMEPVFGTMFTLWT